MKTIRLRLSRPGAERSERDIVDELVITMDEFGQPRIWNTADPKFTRGPSTRIHGTPGMTATVEEGIE